jgi:LysR family transcriptional regulator of abg operon
MNISHLRYLQLIVQTGSFAGAAHEAGVSQPAITQAMQALERECGVVLFEKVGRQKLPTRAALGFTQQAAELQRHLARVTEAGPGEPPQQAGPTLRIGMAPAAALLYGAPIERIWRAHEPEGLMQIISGSAPELLAALSQGDLDLAIAPRPRRFHAEGITQKRLHVSRPAIYVRGGHPLAAATSLASLRDADWAVSGRAGTAGNVIEEAHRVRRLPPPRIRLQCADYATLLTLVAQSDLLCVVPHPALIPERSHPTLQAVPVKEGLPKYEVCLFRPARRPLRNAEAVEAIAAAVKDLVAASEVA